MKTKMIKVVGLVALGLTAACTPDIDTMSVEPTTSIAPSFTGAEYVPNQVLVKFRDGALGRGVEVSSDALALIGGTVNEVISTPTMKGDAARRGVKNPGSLVLIDSETNTLEAINLLRTLDEVEYAEPNYLYTHSGSNDPLYTGGNLWGMYGDATSPTNAFGSQAGEAWAAGSTGSSSVYIGVIDEGYMYEHEDLAGNAATNPGEIAGNGIDDDGNGLVDDVWGYDFANNDASLFDGVDDDHGTHCAGTIGAVGNNNIGVAGVAWNVSLMGAKFLGRRGGTTADAIKAVDYFTDLKTRHGLNIVATNNSWGGGGFSQGLFDAIERANAADILFICAAGNSSNDNDAGAYYPANYTNENVIVVASITSSGNLSSFSSYGATTVDIGAPGSSVVSTVPSRSRGSVVSAYASYSGTSMATPHVAGAAALYASNNPGATAAQIKAAILNSAVPTPSLNGRVATGGRLDVSGF